MTDTPKINKDLEAEVQPFDTEAPDSEAQGIAPKRKVKSNHLISELVSADSGKKSTVTTNLSLATGRQQRKRIQSGQMYIDFLGQKVDELNLSPAAKRFFRFVNIAVTEAFYDYRGGNTVCEVFIPLDYVLNVCPNECEASTIRDFTKQIKVWEHVYITEEYGKYSFHDRGILAPDNGYDEYSRAFKVSIMPWAMREVFALTSSRNPAHEEIFAIDLQKHAPAWELAEKLIAYRWSNPDKEHELLISVDALLRATPSIPSEEEVKAGNRNYKTRIVNRFIKAMRHLEEIGVLDYWEWKHAKGADLTQQEQETMMNAKGEFTKPPDFKLFKTLFVSYALKHDDEEERQRILAERKRHKEIAETRKQKQLTAAEKSKANIQKKAEEKAAEKLADELAKEMGITSADDLT